MRISDLVFRFVWGKSKSSKHGRGFLLQRVLGLQTVTDDTYLLVGVQYHVENALHRITPDPQVR